VSVNVSARFVKLETDVILGLLLQELSRTAVRVGHNNFSALNTSVKRTY